MWNKYNAKRSGGKHSKLEHAVEQILKAREQAKELKLVKSQQRIDFYFQDKKICGYIPDFTCLDLKTNEVFWVEAKGYPTPEWSIKKNLWASGGAGKLEIYTGSYKYPKLQEIIIPAFVGGLIKDLNGLIARATCREIVAYSAN